MALTIESKHYLHTQLELIMDEEAATTMMEAIPPFDWSEVALKKDVEAAITNAHIITNAQIDRKINELAISIHKDMTALNGRSVTWMIAMNAGTLAIISAVIIFAK